jgi:hypothetical protein
MMSSTMWRMHCPIVTPRHAHVHRAVVSPGTVAVLPHCDVGSLGTVATHREWLTGGRWTIVALQPPVCMSCRHLMRRLPHVL